MAGRVRRRLRRWPRTRSVRCRGPRGGRTADIPAAERLRLDRARRPLCVMTDPYSASPSLRDCGHRGRTPPPPRRQKKVLTIEASRGADAAAATCQRPVRAAAEQPDPREPAALPQAAIARAPRALKGSSRAAGQGAVLLEARSATRPDRGGGMHVHARPSTRARAAPGRHASKLHAPDGTSRAAHGRGRRQRSRVGAVRLSRRGRRRRS